MTDRTKKWLKFTVRWGIAALGVWWVVSNINFTDRVLVLDPATQRPRYVAVLNTAREEDATFLVAPDGEPQRTVAREDLWVKPDRRNVTLALPDGTSDARRLLAVKPGGGSVRGRSVEQIVVEGDGTAAQVLPASMVRADAGAGELTVASPYVEVGLTRMVREADRSFLLGALFILPIGYVLTSVRWFLLLRGLGVQIGLGRTFVINMVGAFYNSFMPGTTGGDVIKAYYAAKHTPLRTRAVMTVLIDRVIGLLALIILGGAMAAYQWEVEDCRRVAIGCMVILACASLGAVVFYNRTLRRATGLAFVLRRLPMQAQVVKAVEAMEVFGHRPLPVVGAILVSFPVHAISILSATFAGLAFGLPLRPFYYWVVVPVVALVGAIPISPQGAGVMEFFAVQLTKRHGATISQAFVLTMSIRLLQMFWNLMAGLFVLRGAYHAPTVKEQAEMETDEGAAPAPPLRRHRPDVTHADRGPVFSRHRLTMLRKVDRLILRVPNLQSAVAYYRDVLGLTLVRQEKTVASLSLLDHTTELVLHTDDDLPAEAAYYLVDDVREMYAKRASLKLTFTGPPTASSRGYRAAAKDPFGNVILLLDRTAQGGGKHAVEDARSAGTGALFAGVESKLKPKNDLLASLYEKTGRTADDLPYTPHFESLFKPYAAAFGEPAPTRQETWRHLLNLRKRGALAKLGEARSKPPEVTPEALAQIKQMLGDDAGRRDRLPYSDRFDKLVDEFNKTQPRRLSPHLVWRLVATLAK